MRPKVVITHWVHPEVLDCLRSVCEVVPNQTRVTLSPSEVLRRTKDADAMMVFMPDIVDRQFIEECRNLKIIAGAFKGYDNIDVDSCTRKGVWFTIVADLLTIPTAELAVGLVLSLARNILPGDRVVREGRFTGWRPILYGMGLHGRTAGIVGMGRIGQALARRLAGFEMDLLYCDTAALDRKEEASMHLKRVVFDELLSASDYVILSLPLTEGSFHLINRESLGRMKEGAYLINMGRGSVVDETAIQDAIETGHLAGYAADVFEMEDLSRHDRPGSIPQGLIDDRRTVFTAHLGSAVDDVRRMIALDAAANILQALEGERPRGAINTPSRTKADE